MGYALFIAIALLGGALFIVLVALPLAVIFGLLMSVLRLPIKTTIPLGAVFSGILWGLFMLLDAWVAVRLLHADPRWITGIGTGLFLFASPKVNNARYAVPAAIVCFFTLSLVLLQDMS